MLSSAPHVVTKSISGEKLTKSITCEHRVRIRCLLFLRDLLLQARRFTSALFMLKYSLEVLRMPCLGGAGIDLSRKSTFSSLPLLDWILLK